MPKRSAADKAETHQQILKHASREFRLRGSSVGIADVMKDLGLTHGGFYRHFHSKDDLFIDAITLSFQEIGDRLERAAENAGEGKAAQAIISAYLSTEHLQHPETWCALATLAPEIARMPAATRKRLNAAMMLYMERMAKFMKGRNAQERRQNFMLLFSGMAGAIAMIRSLGEPEMKEGALQLARQHYLQLFATG